MTILTSTEVGEIESKAWSILTSLVRRTIDAGGSLSLAGGLISSVAFRRSKMVVISTIMIERDDEYVIIEMSSYAATLFITVADKNSRDEIAIITGQDIVLGMPCRTELTPVLLSLLDWAVEQTEPCLASRPLA